MRLLSITAYLGALVLLLASSTSSHTSASTARTNSKSSSDSTTSLKSDTPLNIAFCAAFYGRTHAAPQLSLADILVERGHKVTFISADKDVTAWTADHPNVEPVSLGPNPMLAEDRLKLFHKLITGDKDASLLDMGVALFTSSLKDYPSQYRFFYNWLTTRKVDVIVCDFFMDGCFDAAYETNTPFVITMSAFGFRGFATQPYIPDPMDPSTTTHEFSGFFARFYDKVVHPLSMIWHVQPIIKAQKAAYAEVGKEPYTFVADRWRHGLILVNNFFGFEIPRQLPSNVYMIGPAIPHKYKPLPKDLSEFMDARSRVVYVGFGSHTVISRNLFTNIITSLLIAHQDGLLDGAVWGLMRMSGRDDLLPETIVVDEVVHSIKDMQSGKHPVIRLLSKAPQRAVLEHSATRLFISHCGVASIFESMFAAVPILGIPVFADQPNNAITITEEGYGLWIRKSMVNQNTLNEKLRRFLAHDSPDASKFRTNMLNVQKMIRIADRARERGADIIELAAVPGAIKAHESADWRMPWWKANNYDLYAFAIALLGAFVYGGVKTVQYMYISFVKSTQVKQKKA
ncbi:hypothetical protein BDF22DRAFT_636081 [Syncephalis plumigaleata]|nr:hypothetical protein BDF22DRAFT_636081 [Syncephalis plumigaleata]